MAETPRMGPALVNVEKNARRGEILAIRTLISHPMLTGYQRDIHGQPIPRAIVKSLTCAYNGVEVFRAELYPAVAANPFVSFTTLATESGELVFEWTDDSGATKRESVAIVVT